MTENLVMKGPEKWGMAMEMWGAIFGDTAFVREFTQNALDAISKTPEKTGEVYWDYSPIHSAEQGARKLMIVDNGCGMSEGELERLREMHTSGSKMGLSERHGLGGRASSLHYNREGILWLSWQNGVGHGGLLKYLPDEQTFGFEGDIFTVEEWYKEALLGGLRTRDALPIEDHGTAVVFLGNDLLDNTFAAPSGAPVKHAEWIHAILNTRFARFPTGVTVRARVVRPHRGDVMNVVTGALHRLDEAAQLRNKKKLDDGSTVHYWVMPKGYRMQTRDLRGSHAAILYQDELYERKDVRTVNGFGFSRSGNRAVVYLEPDSSRVEGAEFRRREILVDGQNAPWNSWQNEFISPLPEDIARLEGDDFKSSASELDKDVENTLKSMLRLLRPRKYKEAGKRKTKDKNLVLAGPFSEAGTDSLPRDKKPEPDPDKKSTGGGEGGRDPKGNRKYAIAPSDSHEAKLSEPIGGGYRIPRFIELGGDEIDELLVDRAARYIPAEDHILINRDFRGFQDLRDLCLQQAAQSSLNPVTAKQVAMDAVMAEAKKSLGQFVLGTLGLHNGNTWRDVDLYVQALNENALTGVVQVQHHMIAPIVRYLEGKKPKKAA